jgi:hypothetical protein
MKHVIVIETVDGEKGEIKSMLQNVLLRVCEMGITDLGMVCHVQGKFNVDSAIAATHEMYNAPKWNGGL